MEITVENLNCPLCDLAHHDIDQWAIDPHRTHLCLHCGELFKGTLRGVSRPTFVKMDKPADVIYKYKTYRNILDADSETTAQAILAYEEKHMSAWDRPQTLLNVLTGNLNTSHGTFSSYGAAIDFLKSNPDLKHHHIPVVNDYDTEAYKTLHKLHEIQPDDN
ncbi:hypothetical protein OGM63_13520 [Plectonema radiosum NIES-515]|uniref:GATA-type domain-containing protein n=1 Tax=Plectonema radiosum NIES-515 TaxID=2986073 RepID=A0ABT3AZH8_9CYAN|nr:hypothetical protein [Plectonema radiosum]MCV3214519.1 hypothetical protein [Plectonema radiosum NIES-515]